MQSRKEWIKAEVVASWTCVTGDIDENEEACWESEEKSYKFECSSCGWKFYNSWYMWGASYGDVCPNCGVPAHDF